MKWFYFPVALMISLPPAFAAPAVHVVSSEEVPTAVEPYLVTEGNLPFAESPAYVIDVHGNVHDVKAEKEDSTIRKQRSLEERLDKLQAINEYYGKQLADMQKAVEKLTRVVLTLVQILEKPLDAILPKKR